MFIAFRFDGSESSTESEILFGWDEGDSSEDPINENELPIKQESLSPCN